MKFDWRKLEVCSDVGVLDCQHIIYMPALDPLSCYAGRCDGTTTSKCFEFGLDDCAVVSHLMHIQEVVLFG